MYDDNDNAWPDTAPISSFIPERKLPARVRIAAIVLVSAAGLNTLTAILSMFLTARQGILSSIQAWSGMAGLVLSLLLLAATVTLAIGLFRGRRWAPNITRWVAGVYAAGCGLFGLIANPKAAGTQVGFGWFITVIAIASALGGIVCLSCMFGESVTRYFAVTSADTHGVPQQPAGGAPIGGYDRDWTPPTQDSPNAPGSPSTGFRSDPPSNDGYGGGLGQPPNPYGR